MQSCGYSEKFRMEVVASAMKAFDTMVAKDQNGEEPLYRPKGWKRVKRAMARRSKKEDSFKDGKEGSNNSVVFVLATPGRVLKRRYEKTISEAGVRIAVKINTWN